MRASSANPTTRTSRTPAASGRRPRSTQVSAGASRRLTALNALRMLDHLTQRGRQGRSVDLQRIARFDRAAAVLAEPPAQLAAGKQPSELVDPFVFARGEKP